MLLTKKMLLAQRWQRNNRFLHWNDFIDFRVERVSPGCIKGSIRLFLAQVRFNSRIAQFGNRAKRKVPCQTAKDFRLFLGFSYNDVSFSLD